MGSTGEVSSKRNNDPWASWSRANNQVGDPFSILGRNKDHFLEEIQNSNQTYNSSTSFFFKKKSKKVLEISHLNDEAKAELSNYKNKLTLLESKFNNLTSPYDDQKFDTNPFMASLNFLDQLVNGPKIDSTPALLNLFNYVMKVCIGHLFNYGEESIKEIQRITLVLNRINDNSSIAALIKMLDSTTSMAESIISPNHKSPESKKAIYYFTCPYKEVLAQIKKIFNKINEAYYNNRSISKSENPTKISEINEIIFDKVNKMNLIEAREMIENKKATIGTEIYKIAKNKINETIRAISNFINGEKIDEKLFSTKINPNNTGPLVQAAEQELQKQKNLYNRFTKLPEHKLLVISDPKARELIYLLACGLPLDLDQTSIIDRALKEPEEILEENKKLQREIKDFNFSIPQIEVLCNYLATNDKKREWPIRRFLRNPDQEILSLDTICDVYSTINALDSWKKASQAAYIKKPGDKKMPITNFKNNSPAFKDIISKGCVYHNPLPLILIGDLNPDASKRLSSAIEPELYDKLLSCEGPFNEASNKEERKEFISNYNEFSVFTATKYPKGSIASRPCDESKQRFDDYDSYKKERFLFAVKNRYPQHFNTLITFLNNSKIMPDDRKTIPIEQLHQFAETLDQVKKALALEDEEDDPKTEEAKKKHLQVTNQIKEKWESIEKRNPESKTYFENKLIELVNNNECDAFTIYIIKSMALEEEGVKFGLKRLAMAEEALGKILIPAFSSKGRNPRSIQ